MRFPLRLALLAAFLPFLAPPPLAADGGERSLDGGAHIWMGTGLSEFRAFVGPRWHWDGFTLHFNGAIGAAFLSGVGGTPLSLGAYGDADYLIDLGDEKGIRVGAGGGGGSVLGIQDLTGWLVPQGYGQIGYRWGVNFVGVQALVGPSYKRPDNYPAYYPSRIGFTGVGLRFEYEINPPR